MQDPVVLLAMVPFGEAQNQSDEAKLAVCCVVRNRVRARIGFGNSYPAVILRPNAFSAFNPSDPNRKKLLTPTRFAPLSVWESCYSAAQRIYQDQVSDNTNGSLFYFSPPLTEPPQAWGHVEFAVSYGDMHFYRAV